MNGHELFDEHDIRRALQLDADEMPPRFDPRVIAAAARASRSGTSMGIVVAASIAFAGGWMWSEIFRALVSAVLASTGFDLLGTLISALDALAEAIAPIAEAASVPTVPIAILAAAVIAAVFERMKGRTDATPS